MSFFNRVKCAECGEWHDRGAHRCASAAPAESEAVDLEAMREFERWGYNAALRGETTCPFAISQEVAYRQWHRGYDIAERAGLATLPRFRDASRRRRLQCDTN